MEKAANSELPLNNNRLSKEDGDWANELLDRIREELTSRAGDDLIRLHLLRRKVAKKLIYDERSTPMQRRALKKRKMIEQKGICAICGMPLPDGGAYAVLDRAVAHLGYTDANVNLVHAECDYKEQAKKGYT
jgi:hypothetical protein